MAESKAAVSIPRSQVSIKTVLTVTTTAVAVLGSLYILFNAEIALSLIIGASVIAVALHHVVDRLRRLGVGRRLAITLVMFAVVLLVAGIALLFIPTAVAQIRAMVEAAPGLLDKFQHSRLYQRYNAPLELDQHLSELRGVALRHIQDALNAAFQALTSVLTVVTATVTVFFLVIFMLAFGDGLIRRLLNEATPGRRERYERMLSKIYRAIGGYIGGLFLVVLNNAVFTSIFLAIIRVPYFLLLGVISGLSSLIPLVGNTLAGVIITLIALATVGFWKAVATAIWFIVYQQFENHLLGPAVYRKTVDVNPLVVVITVLILTELSGIVGAIVAVPFVAMGQIVLRELFALRREYLNLPLEGPASHPPPK